MVCGLVSLGLHYFLQLSLSGLMGVLVPGCCLVLPSLCNTMASKQLVIHSEAIVCACMWWQEVPLECHYGNNATCRQLQQWRPRGSHTTVVHPWPCRGEEALEHIPRCYHTACVCNAGPPDDNATEGRSASPIYSCISVDAGDNPGMMATLLHTGFEGSGALTVLWTPLRCQILVVNHIRDAVRHCVRVMQVAAGVPAQH